MADITIRGSKGGSSSFKNTPDNLRSNDTFEGVLGVAIGPLKGPTRGLKSIKLDGTPVENETGELNFGGFTVGVGNGDPTLFPQVIQLKLGAAGAPVPVNLALTNSNPSAPGAWATRTLSNTNADFIDFRFIVSQLYQQTSKGIYDGTLTLEIQMKPVGTTTWINPTIGSPTGTYNEQGVPVAGNQKLYLPQHWYDGITGDWLPQTPNYRITGKTNSPAVYELRINVPNEGVYADKGWDVRVRLIEKDSVDNDPNFEKRTISWESMSAVYGSTLGTHEDWRGVAWLQIYGKASDQLSGIPEVTGEWDCKIVSVPASGVYNPDTRVYSGTIWDGSWSKAWTNDPAWIINDVISDPLAGVSLLAPGSYLNKWDALEASKWFSELVPDGAGGYHPRYSLNLAINDPQKAEDLVRYMAGAVGALAWDQGDGEWRMKCDKPENPVDIFTLDNIEGEFIYSHTDVDTRFNDITGSFLNAEMDYRQDSVRLPDNDSIALLGRKPTNIALVGCTNRQEALRRVKLRLRSTVNETKIVNFVTNRRGLNVEQLDMILVADGDLGDQDKRTTGRTVAVSSDRMTITVRDPMRLEVGVAYTMKFASVNPAYDPDTGSQPVDVDWKKPTLVMSRNVTNTSGQRGNVVTIHLDTALPADIPDNLAVALEATSLPTLPKLYRVTNVARQDDGERIAISALEVDVGKWDASDNVTNEDTVFQDLTGQAPKPLLPTAGDLLSLVAVPTDNGLSVNLVANWRRPPGSLVAGFRVRYSFNGGAWTTAAEKLQQTTFELVNPAPGTYVFEIVTYNRQGALSQPLTGEFDLDENYMADILADLTGLQEEVDIANANALEALQSLEDLGDDGLISINEKITYLIPLNDQLYGEWAYLDGKAAELVLFPSIVAARSTATAAMVAWATYRDTISPDWDDITQDTPVVRTTYRGKIQTLEQALVALSDAMRLVASNVANQAASDAIYEPFNYATTTAFNEFWITNAGADVSIVTTTDTDGKAIQLGNNSGNDLVVMESLRTVAYSPEDLYEVSYDIEVVNPGSGTLYMGVQSLNAGGARLTSDAGTYNYLAAINLAQSTVPGRRTYKGYARGTATVGAGNNVGGLAADPASPSTLPNTTAKIGLVVLANYPSAAGKVIIHEATLRKIVDNSVVATGPWLSTRSYFRNESATYLGRSFGSKADGNLAHTPPATATSDSYWYLIADKGTDGQGTTTLINKANMIISGGTATKTSSSGWDGSVHSAESYVGDVMAIAQVTSTATNRMLGLNSDPNTDANYTSIDFAIYASGSSFSVYENGTPISAFGSIAVGNFIYVRRRGTTIEYGVLGEASPRHSHGGVSATTNLYLDTAFYDLGSELKSIQLMPLASSGAGAFNLVNIANAQIDTPTSVNFLTNSWTAKAKTKESYRGAAVSGYLQVDSGIGLDINPDVDASYGSVDYWFHRSANGNIYYYRNGTAISSFPDPDAATPLVPSGPFTVVSDGTTIRYYYKNAEITAWAHAVNSAGEVLFGTFNGIANRRIEQISFAPSGLAGTNGLNGIAIPIYRRSVGTPTLPSATTTYDFTTKVLSGLNNGWTTTVPAGTDPLWQSGATASSNTNTDTIAASEWATPQQIAVNGDTPAKIATAYLYQRTATSTPPSVPSTTTTFTFATGGMTGFNNGWSVDLPASGGPYRWRIQATAVNTGTTDTIATGEWTSPQILAEDGSPGTPGINALSVSATPGLNVSVPCTAGGTPKAALSSVQLKVLQASTDVTASSSYTVTASSNVSTPAVSSGGLVTVTGMGSGLTGTVEVTISHGGATFVATVTYTKALDGAAYVDGSASVGAPSSTSYQTVATLSLLMGPSGTISLDTNGGFNPPTGVINIQGTIDYSLNGGSSWTTAVAIAGIQADPSNGWDGSWAADVNLNGTTIGLTTKQSVMFRVTMRKTNTNTFSSFSGSLYATWSG